jgi:hypothetical protein
MSNPIAYSRFGASRQTVPRLAHVSTGRTSSFWCEVADTQWSKTMRNHVVAAGLVSGQGAPRTWGFYSDPAAFQVVVSSLRDNTSAAFAISSTSSTRTKLSARLSRAASN